MHAQLNIFHDCPTTSFSWVSISPLSFLSCMHVLKHRIKNYLSEEYPLRGIENLKVQKPTTLVVGLLLLLFGISLFLWSFSSAMRTDIVIDTSFILEPGETQEEYHHTRILSKSALTGAVSVEGEGINFTAYFFNTQHLEDVYINQNFSFAIDPADDLYIFIFDNSRSDGQSSINFTLEESWMAIPLLILSFIGLLVLTPTGLILTIISLRK